MEGSMQLCKKIWGTLPQVEEKNEFYLVDTELNCLGFRPFGSVSVVVLCEGFLFVLICIRERLS